MSIVNAIAAPLSHLPLWWKKSTPLKQNSEATPVTTQDDREEDGFTFVGESESERNTVYPQNRKTPWDSPPPSYYQVSSLYSSPYNACCESSKLVSHAHNTNMQLQKTANDQEMQKPTMEQLLPNAIPSIKACMQDVPFTLAPHINDNLTEDVHLVQFPSVDLSAFMYDFSLETHVSLSALDEERNHDSHQTVHRDDDTGNGNFHVDQCGSDSEDQDMPQYEHEAGVAQDIQDLIGEDLTGYKGTDTQQDLISF